MAAEFSFTQVSGAYPGTRQDVGSFGELMSFKAVDAYGKLQDFDENLSALKIAPGSQSVEIWFQLHFTGDFNSVSNITLFLAPVVSPVLPQGLSVKFNGQQVNYQTPSSAHSTIATTNMPTDWSGGANVSIGGSLSNTIGSSGGYTDFICMQLQVASGYQLGYIDPLTICVRYLES